MRHDFKKMAGVDTAVPGEPVEARLVVSRILSEDGEVLAEWLLMSNIMDMDANTLALWYYPKNCS